MPQRDQDFQDEGVNKVVTFHAAASIRQAYVI